MIGKRLIILFAILGITARANAQPAHLPQSKNKTVVIAHRGNHMEVPENTVASCREAIECGADYVEVDLRTTKDGKLVLLHDAKVDRTTNGSGRIADMTLAEVRKLQVFNRNKKTHRIPEFKEVLAVCKGKINIYLDFKDASTEETWKQIKAAGMESQVVVYLNDERQYRQWKEAAPTVPLMTSLPNHVTSKDGLLGFLKKTDVQVLDNVKDPELVKVANQHGVAVWLDVQSPNEGPASWKEALSKGVQGLQTDTPVHLMSFLKGQN
ncbi:glycerophosphodiester phosphodiesterase family protein [Dyadobacter sp. Leaf189]|uniref:glycerophosphodiester phosphodiesterase family protein n=1 Tax=Dyadobacter sp. Leaf189 TaxID=1736295 RepID=UPI0006F7EE1A|nr:glycerophosphodiester phosphodiesterase family protein [Dyadobacter sp. Leaf189]KQS32637.1 glycerophosphodiester phosphodiesterase [Dyadobacter sp. Leaf189]